MKVARRAVLVILLLVNVIVLGLALTGRLMPSVSLDRPFSLPSARSVAAAQDSTGNLLLVNDVQTANAALQPVPLMAPAGFSDRGNSVNLVPGFSISLLAAGLKS